MEELEDEWEELTAELEDEWEEALSELAEECDGSVEGAL